MCFLLYSLFVILVVVVLSLNLMFIKNYNNIKFLKFVLNLWYLEINIIFLFLK